LGVPSHPSSANGGSVNSQDSLWNIKNSEVQGYSNRASFVPSEYVMMQKQGKHKGMNQFFKIWLTKNNNNLFKEFSLDLKNMHTIPILKSI